MSAIDSTAWMTDAACQYVDPEIFFVEPGLSAAQARSVCMRCEVRPACLSWAIETRQQDGVLGGMTERERKRFAAGRQELRTAA